MTHLNGSLGLCPVVPPPWGNGGARPLGGVWGMHQWNADSLMISRAFCRVGNCIHEGQRVHLSYISEDPSPTRLRTTRRVPSQILNPGVLRSVRRPWLYSRRWSMGTFEFCDANLGLWCLGERVTDVASLMDATSHDGATDSRCRRRGEPFPLYLSLPQILRRNHLLPDHSEHVPVRMRISAY